MKKSLLAVAMLLLVSSKQILACDYYENGGVIWQTLETGIYHKNVSGVVCSSDKRFSISIINGKIEGLVKFYYESGALESEANYKNGKQEGLEKWYYESGALKLEVNYKNDKEEGLEKVYYESGIFKV